MRLLAVIAAIVVSSAATAAPVDEGAIDAAVSKFMTQNDVAAMHVTVLDDDRIVYRKGFGGSGNPATAPDAQTIFPIASISKHFVAATIHALADDGRLDLSAPVARYLPEWFADEPGITVSHLLAHTSGLPEFLGLDGYRALADDPRSTMADYLALADAAPRRFAAGTRWSYSNTNFKALALIVERVTGEPFHAAQQRLVLGPAGVPDIVACHDLAPGAMIEGFKPDGAPAPLDASAAAYTGDGSLCASSDALVRWLRHGLGKNGPLRRMARAARVEDTEVPYDNGLSVRPFLGQPMIWHGGNLDGHSLQIAHSVTQRRSAILLSNKGYVWLTELLPAIFDLAPPIGKPVGQKVPEGRFEDGLFNYVLTRTGDTLTVDIDLIGPIEFLALSPTAYAARDLPASFQLRVTDDAGDRFEFDWGDVRSYAHRVRD